MQNGIQQFALFTHYYTPDTIHLILCTHGPHILYAYSSIPRATSRSLPLRIFYHDPAD